MGIFAESSRIPGALSRFRSTLNYLEGDEKMNYFRQLLVFGLLAGSLVQARCSQRSMSSGVPTGGRSKPVDQDNAQTPPGSQTENATQQSSTPNPSSPPTALPAVVDAPKPNYRIAFVGDQGATVDSQAVLKLIKASNVQLMVVLGDFDYTDDPNTWDKMLTDTLGDSFPVIAAVGNHDTGAWPGYKAKLTTRLAKLKDITCDGDYGVNMKCKVPGITLAISGVGTMGTGHEAYLDKTLAEAKTPWKVCNWHKNQKLLQVGGKTDEVGYLAYETCLKYGAFVATGHEHSYERTHLLSSMEKQTIASKESKLVLEPGKSFAFVSGLGGREVRNQELAGDWWAKIYTSNQAATFGVLLCDFNIENNPRKAHCQFKNIAGQIVDDFYMESQLPVN